MCFLNALGVKDFRESLLNHIDTMIDLRKLVFDLGSDEKLKKRLIARDDCLTFMNGLSNTTDNALIVREPMEDIWEENLLGVFDETLTKKAWSHFKVECRPHPKFPNDKDKFDPKYFKQSHFDLQSSAMFVGPLLMENYVHLRFRVVIFQMTIYAGVNEFPPPDASNIYVMDARSGKEVIYSYFGGEDEKPQYDEEMDDGQTFFMFADSAHVNSMYRQPRTEPVEVSEELLFQTSRIFQAKNPCPHKKDQWKTFRYKPPIEDAANWVAPSLQPIRKFQFNQPPRTGYLGNDMEFDSIQYDSSTPSYQNDRFGDFAPFLIDNSNMKPLPPPSIRALLLAGVA